MRFLKRLLGIRSPEEKEYVQFLEDVFTNKDFSESRQATLLGLRKKLEADDPDWASNFQRKIEGDLFRRLYEHLATDDKITNAENEVMNCAATLLQRHPKEYAFWDSGAYSLCRYRGHLADGEILPWPNSDVDVRMAPGETFLFGCATHLVKKKKVTKRINYSGLTYTVRITKGLRYRIGSIKAQRITQEEIVSVDTGTIWVSTHRIGFRGNDKNVIVDLKKVAVVDVDEGLLTLFKSGKENPYLFHTLYLDTICGVVSLVMEGNYKLLENESSVA